MKRLFYLLLLLAIGFVNQAAAQSDIVVPVGFNSATAAKSLGRARLHVLEARQIAGAADELSIR